jgi:type II secretory pathway pseudopilin PulG
VKHIKAVFPRARGFALVVTLSLMVLLTIVAVGLLSLSAISVRSATQGSAQAQAQANARLALMMALGELQKEMGPDMRVSAESAIFDTNKDSESIEGVAQSRWLASYNSWGNWLNAKYSPPDSKSGSLPIADTYTPKREKMFRRWLLSMPKGEETDVDSPNKLTGWDETNSVVLVGPGSLGDSAPSDQTTRAYLTKVVKNNVKTGNYAWWIGPENHKARIDKAKKIDREGNSNSAWELSHGDTAEVGVGKLDGFSGLDNNSTISEKLITTQTLSQADVTQEKVQDHFFDLTAASRGVLTSVRAGHLKKDLSLLFEGNKSNLPTPYRFNTGDVREPSIRPMSSEIASKPVLKERHFASWTSMRHFYRMYRQDNDEEARSFDEGGTDESKTTGLDWQGSKPFTKCNVNRANSSWGGQDTYHRFPVLTNLTLILGLKTRPSTPADTYQLDYVVTPVYVYWNPYNVEMRVPVGSLATRCYLMQVQPLLGQYYHGDTIKKSDYIMNFNDDDVFVMERTSSEIVFKPGEFRIYTAEPGAFTKGATYVDVYPGFEPDSFGGLFDDRLGKAKESDKPNLEITFSSHAMSNNLFNSRHGNTPGSMVNQEMWSKTSQSEAARSTLPFNFHVDWLNTSPAQATARITQQGFRPKWIFDQDVLPVGYIQLVLKSMAPHEHSSISWAKDWRCRNWIQAPPFYLGKGLYMSEDEEIAHTQRMDCPYEFRFGPLGGSGGDVDQVIQHLGDNALLSTQERITAAPLLELPTAPIGSLAGFSGMRIEPGWVDISLLNPDWKKVTGVSGRRDTSGGANDKEATCLYFGESKAWAYQSGVTGPGIGNSFLHPMIPRTDVYRFLNNSVSMQTRDFQAPAKNNAAIDTKAYCDYWDHVLLLNDALWDDYFVSSLADQTRPGASAGASLGENIQKLVNGEDLANSRYMPYLNGRSASAVKDALDDEEGYLKAASHLMVDGMFNVNSTSVDAWHALFAGIRERKLVYRAGSGSLQTVTVSSDNIAISRFNTETTDKDGSDPEFGVKRDDNMLAWSGVRFLSNDQLRKLAEECVKQVKLRGPFLNFSEFINRRLSNDDLGTMGALQSAIDYDDNNPDSGSINYNFKNSSDFMLKSSDLGSNSYATPEAAVGSRFAGIPGYVIQSDLLKPIANTLSVRDDTFRIRTYGEALDKSGNIIARAWCEAIVQRYPEYSDAGNDPEVPARTMNASGEFSDIDNSELNASNRRFGRKFQIESFRWLSGSEI